MTLRVRVLDPRSLTRDLAAAWLDIISSNPDLSSPFFAPEYAQAVASAVPTVRVAIAERHGEVVALLPFERHLFSIGRRLRLCDYQALICKPSTTLPILPFIQACGLRAWDFDHLLASQTQLVPFQTRLLESPIIDLSAGFTHYVTVRRAAGTHLITKVSNLMRRLARDVGPIHFEANTNNTALIEQMLRWRWLKYPGTRHPFTLVLRILSALIHMNPAPACTPVLSALHAGDRLAAVHFGLRSAHIWHYWIPAYNPDLHRYSPGLALLLKIIEYAAATGLRSVHLGPGTEDYKRRLMTGALLLAAGSVEVCPHVTLLRRFRRRCKAIIRRGSAPHQPNHLHPSPGPDRPL
jgi:CelD/BcsL family acetyltransferase involved in cellulose biosynthesis